MSKININKDPREDSKLIAAGIRKQLNSRRILAVNLISSPGSGKTTLLELVLPELSKELRQIVRDLQIDIPLSLRARFWIRVGERVFDRTSTIISELERLGIETTQLEQIHSKAQTNLSLAKTKYESGDINGSIDALHDLKSNFIELKDVYLELIFGGELTETLETAVELTSDALEKTIDEMDKTI